MINTFKKWLVSSDKYKPLGKKIEKKTVAIAKAFFEEEKTLHPGYYEVWWARNHNRFIREYKQTQLALLHECIYAFLAACATGKVSSEEL